MWPWRKRTSGSAAPGGVRRVVDDHVFLLGLDELYRGAIKLHESNELLACARRVGSALGTVPDTSVPIEGYYGESPALTEYFQWMRALQRADLEQRPAVAGLVEYQRLLAVASSRHLACAFVNKGLMPMARDALSIALLKTETHWNVPDLMTASAHAARAADDISLVGMAAIRGDRVALAAVRETAVLYAEVVLAGAPPPMDDSFAWEVSTELASRGARFVRCVNELLGEALPAPDAAAAEIYWYACQRNKVLGRCVHIGVDSRKGRDKHYHWAVVRADGELVLQDFWDEREWTTAQYRQAHSFPG